MIHFFFVLPLFVATLYICRFWNCTKKTLHVTFVTDIVTIYFFGSVRSLRCHNVCLSVRPAQVCPKHWILSGLSQVCEGSLDPKICTSSCLLTLDVCLTYFKLGVLDEHNKILDSACLLWQINKDFFCEYLIIKCNILLHTDRTEPTVRTEPTMREHTERNLQKWKKKLRYSW